MPSSTPMGRRARHWGRSLGAFGEMFNDDVFVITEAVAEVLANEHCGFYSDKKQGVVVIAEQSFFYWVFDGILHSILGGLRYDSGSGLLHQPDLLVLGARRPPRVGAPYARPPKKAKAGASSRSPTDIRKDNENQDIC